MHSVCHSLLLLLGEAKSPSMLVRFPGMLTSRPVSDLCADTVLCRSSLKSLPWRVLAFSSCLEECSELFNMGALICVRIRVPCKALYGSPLPV